ncbi:MAG: SDR family NAD(P)-dependent oxidoreductase, partial [Aeromonas salmonicida]
MTEAVVVIGAGGGIGQALVAYWLAAGADPVIAVSRQQAPVGFDDPRL